MRSSLVGRTTGRHQLGGNFTLKKHGTKRHSENQKSILLFTRPRLSWFTIRVNQRQPRHPAFNIRPNDTDLVHIVALPARTEPKTTQKIEKYSMTALKKYLKN